MTSAFPVTYSARIQGHHLVVEQIQNFKTQAMCLLDVRQRPSFYLGLGCVVCRDGQGREFTLDTVDVAQTHDLLNQLVDAQISYRDHGLIRWAGIGVVIGAAGALLAVLIVNLLISTAWTRDDGLDRRASRPVSYGVPEGVSESGVLPGWAPAFGEVAPDVSRPSARVQPSYPMPSRVEPSPLPRASAEPIAPARPAQDAEPALTSTPPSPVVAPTVDDGWSLPVAVRATLPERLHKAAERQLFTVDYSRGHPRTLYVFADPACPNCQRLEPALQAASSLVNVVVFPVAVIGKASSIAAITPVLCLPPEQRPAAWQALFDLGHDGLSLGQATNNSPVAGPTQPAGESGACDMAEKALGVNEVAYQTYQIPGTPWVMADDGRPVSQALLRDPVRLQAFLDNIDRQEPGHE